MSDTKQFNAKISTKAKLQNMHASDGVSKLYESDAKSLQSENALNANNSKSFESSEELYEPLQRPIYVGRRIECNDDASQVSLEDGELLDPDNENSSDSEFSSDNLFGTVKPLRVERKVLQKRPIMVRVNTPNETRTSFKKNNIWVETLEEETLNETMRSVNVCAELLNKRSVESYQYPRYVNRKRRVSHHEIHRHRYTSKKQRRTASNKKQDDAFNFSPLGDKSRHNKERNIPDLKDIEGRDAADIAQEIANNLHERKYHLIERILNILGMEIPLEIYKETQAIEKEGGMMILSGKRRRTSGGVYFYLLKGDERIEKEKRDEIFEFCEDGNSKWGKSMNDQCSGDLDSQGTSSFAKFFLPHSDLGTKNHSGNLSNPPPLMFGNNNSSNVVPEANLQCSVRSSVTKRNVSTESKYLDEDVIDFNKMDLS